MKRILLICLLTLAIVCSIIAGTLASYTVRIGYLASGNLVAKNFVFIKDGTDTFEQGIEIAPGESLSWSFAIRNYDGSVVTETNLYYRLTFDIHATNGKQAIVPLEFILKDKNGAAVGTATGTDTIIVTGTFPLFDSEQSDAYTLEIRWPQNDSVDVQYAGQGFGSSVNVQAVASQAPLDNSTQSSGQSAISVSYLAQDSWTEGAVWDPAIQSLTGGVQKHGFKIIIYPIAM